MNLFMENDYELIYGKRLWINLWKMIMNLFMGNNYWIIYFNESKRYSLNDYEFIHLFQ